MFYHLKDRLKRRKFNSTAKGILTTPPVIMQNDALASVFTQLQHKDVLMFLVALKSFAHQIPLNQIFILNDGSLTTEDNALLSKHIEQVKFLELNDIPNEHCPHGGTWERLLAIADLVADRYLIQLDSDTVTLGPITEVVEHIQNNRSFVIGTWDGQIIEPMKECSDRVLKKVNPNPDAHVQMVAEAYFRKLEECTKLRYIRGSSGFSGFSKGSIDKSFIEKTSTNIEKLIGSKWHEWGSEQVMSNIVVANTPNAAVLPHPKYCDCTKINSSDTQFIHYVGSCRFTTKHYTNTVASAIASLNNKV